MSLGDKSLSLSIVVPVYSGANFLQSLVTQVAEVREDWIKQKVPFQIAEVIFVDDSAIDGSPEVLAELAKQHSWVSVLTLSRNFGQHPATIAGILHSSGDWVVTMDEDLQHLPQDIVHLLRSAAENSSDVVYAKPMANVHGGLSRDFSSRTFKKLIERMTGNENVSDFSSFRLIRGDIARGAASSCIHDTYFDIALSWFTKSISLTTLDITDKRHQETGQSGYKFRSLISHARRMLFSSDLKILRVFALLGIVVMAATFIVGAGTLLLKLFSPAAIAVQGWTSTVLVIGFFGGTTLAVLSVILEYLSLLVRKAHGKPLYFSVDRSSDDILTSYFSEPK